MNKVDFRSQPSSNTVTEEEQAAIDAWLAKNKPKKIPTGKSGYEFQYRWVPAAETSRFDDGGGGHLRLVDSAGNFASRNETLAAFKQIGKKANRKLEGMRKRAETRAKVRATIDAGITNPHAIANHLGMSHQTVMIYFKELGYEVKHLSTKDILLEKMETEWRTIEEVAQITSTQTETVRKVLNDMRREGLVERKLSERRDRPATWRRKCS